MRSVNNQTIHNYNSIEPKCFLDNSHRFKKLCLNLFIYILIVVIVLSSCSDKRTVEDPADQNNPFEASDNGLITRLAMSYGPDVDDIYAPIEYVGVPIEIPYSIQNDGPLTDTSVLLFLDGILQEYQTSFDDEPRFIHTVSLEPDENLAFTLIIDPGFGKAGETHLLGFSTIMNPDFVPDYERKGSPTFPSTDDLTIAKITFLFDASNPRDMISPFDGERVVAVTDEQKSFLSNRRPSGLSENEFALEFDFFDRSGSLCDRNQPVYAVDQARIIAYASGGSGMAFRLYLFAAGEPLVTHGFGYIDFEIIAGEFTGVEFEIDFSSLSNGELFTLLGMLVAFEPYTADGSVAKTVQSPVFVISS
ncbi:MAG: hypothetical protein FWH40_07440 [Coriobacteriia bacterium]|nr:hypothetical protein [Coriobacteriia bacterium]